MILNRLEAQQKIHDTDGKIFGVKFIKRTDGSLREMAARLGVKKGVKGVGRAFNPADYDLIGCYDMNNGFRMIPIDGILELQIDGVRYEVK